jgi:tripartite-type tricarboxylate transporter receptor subunit TctC
MARLETAMLTRRALALAVAASATGLNIASFAAETYPARIIKVIVPFPPGVPSEIIYRLVADRLSAKFGQPVIIENRPGGAGGTVGAEFVANAEPDGYTLLASAPGPLVTAAALYKNLGYEPSSSFTPIALLFTSPELLAVNSALPAKSLQELVSYVKSRPGRINFASAGYGTQPHLLGEMLKSGAGIDIVHVPYKGNAAAITDLLAGQVQIYFATPADILPHIVGGKVRVIAVADTLRFLQLPDVPTTVESGFPSLTAEFWSGILAPAGTSATVVDQLNLAINEIMLAPEARLALNQIGGQAKTGTPQDFKAFITMETQKWSAIIKATGVKID